MFGLIAKRYVSLYQIQPKRLNLIAQVGIFFLVILRAHDESSGNITTLGVRERYDCQEWARWVVSRVGEDVHIFLMGLSFDGAIALMSRDLDFPNSVSGIIDS